MSEPKEPVRGVEWLKAHKSTINGLYAHFWGNNPYPNDGYHPHYKAGASTSPVNRVSIREGK